MNLEPEVSHSKRRCGRARRSGLRSNLHALRAGHAGHRKDARRATGPAARRQDAQEHDHSPVEAENIGIVAYPEPLTEPGPSHRGRTRDTQSARCAASSDGRRSVSPHRISALWRRQSPSGWSLQPSSPVRTIRLVSCRSWESISRSSSGSSWVPAAARSRRSSPARRDFQALSPCGPWT
jgi:hypothetical protein